MFLTVYKKYIIIFLLVLLFLILWLGFLKNKSYTNISINNINTWSLNQDKKEKKDPLGWLNINTKPITEDIKPWENNSAFLTEISKKIEEENLKKELENKKYVDNFSVIIKDYAISINENKNILSFISNESINKIKDRTLLVYSRFNNEEKQAFINDLKNVWFSISDNFNIVNTNDFNSYMDFMIKYPLKSKWKIIEVSEFNWKRDEQTGIFCWTFQYKFDNNKTMNIESLCLDKNNKMLIHNL